MAEIVKTIDDAVLTGGANILAASGGLPRRIVQTQDVVLTNNDDYLPYSPPTENGAVFDIDDTHLWTTNYGSTRLTKWNFKTGANIYSVTGNRPVGLWVCPERNEIWRITTPPYALVAQDLDTHVVTIPTTSVAVSCNTLINVPGIADKAWTGGLYATPVIHTEVQIPACGTATGRTINTGVNGYNTGFWAALSDDGTPSLFSQTGTTIKQYRESDLALLNTWSAPAGPAVDTYISTFVAGTAGYGGFFNSGMTIDPWDGKPCVAGYITGQIDKIDYPGAAMTADKAKRIMWSDPEIGGSLGWNPAGWFMPGFDFKGDYFLYIGAGSTSKKANLVRVAYRGTSIASWSETFTKSGTLTRVNVIGDLGGIQGTVAQAHDQPKDFRRVKMYYRKNGGAYTAFTTGSRINEPIAVGDTIDVKAEMCKWMCPPGPDAYIGGVDDEAIVMYLTDPTGKKERFYGGIW